MVEGVKSRKIKWGGGESGVGERGDRLCGYDKGKKISNAKGPGDGKEFDGQGPDR